MRDIQASAEVAGMMGAENLHELRHSPGYGPFRCWHCGGRGDANTEPVTVIAELGPRDGYAEATTVIAERDEDAARTALAHAECSPSQVVSTGPLEPLALTEPGTGRQTARSDWQIMMADLPGPDGFQPLLILDLRSEMAVRTGPDESVTRCISALLSMGLTPVTTIGEQFTEAVGGHEGTSPGPWILPRVAGWRFEMSGRRRARLTAPDGSVVWGRDYDLPLRWRGLLTRTGLCVVLIGAIGLYPTVDRPFTWPTTLLAQAAQAGELVGGRVRTGWVGDADSSG
ncbi:MAG TPA: hypothetical protein VG756_31715 [Pseudonocardiaceae bacterium]|nr:hypothetical protein [Pseudonocardiaceae bacterium]